MGKSLSMTCEVCLSKDHHEAIRARDHLVSQKIFIINECNSCGFRFLGNPPAEDEAYKYYESEDYVEHSDSSQGLINTVYHWARQWMFRYKYSILQKLGNKKHVLDIGTGTGYFLNYMEARGYQTKGIEISEKARGFGQEKFGLSIDAPTALLDDDFPDDFGYITFWHVLEHVYDPRKMLSRVKSLLQDDGTIIIALPNHKSLDQRYYKSYWAAYDVPRHLWHWDKKSFTQFANSVGLKIKKTKMLPLDPFYNCLISESYRKKNWAYILIPFIGAASLLLGWISNEKASSIIYFLEKE